MAVELNWPDAIRQLEVWCNAPDFPIYHRLKVLEIAKKRRVKQVRIGAPINDDGKTERTGATMNSGCGE
jgi:hypothetical protein